MPPTTHADTGQVLDAPNGSRLHIEFDGPADGPVLVLTHGWALDSDAWYSVRREFAQTYRLVLWDLPGLGRSSQPADHRYLIERLAEDLRTVIAQTGNAPVTLVGHSIGGMMMLTLARLHPVLSPLIRQSNFMSYMNGTSHIVNLLTSLSGNVTREQLDFASRYNVKDTPSVIAKGLRAVLRWDETATPGAIHVLVRAITGDVDKLTKPEAGIEISRLAPNADFVRLAPVGHNGLIEQGPRYAEAIRQFMRRTTLVVS